MQTLTELSFIEHLKGLLLMLKGPSQLEKKKKKRVLNSFSILYSL